MKKIIIGIIAIIVIVTLVLCGIGTIGSNPYWETETGFGMWQDEIEIGYTDGTTQSLKLLQEGSQDYNPFTVYYQGQAINYVKYKVAAAVTGEGYDGAKIDTNDFWIAMYIDGDYKGGEQTSGIRTVPMGSSIEIMRMVCNAGSYLEPLPDGTHTVKFCSRGSMTFWGYPSGEDPETATLPPDRQLSVTVSHEIGQIVVTLSSDIWAE